MQPSSEVATRIVVSGFYSHFFCWKITQKEGHRATHALSALLLLWPVCKAAEQAQRSQPFVQLLLRALNLSASFVHFVSPKTLVLAAALWFLRELTRILTFSPSAGCTVCKCEKQHPKPKAPVLQIIPYRPLQSCFYLKYIRHVWSLWQHFLRGITSFKIKHKRMSCKDRFCSNYTEIQNSQN